MNIVIFRTDKMGDLIISTPLFRAIKARHPEAKLMLVASPYNAVVVKGLPVLDAVVLYDPAMDRVQKRVVQEQIRAFNPTHTLVLSPKNACYFMAWHSGAQMRGGLLMGYRWLPRLLAPLLLTHRITIPRSRKGAHQAERMLQLAAQMGLAEATPLPPYHIAYDPVAPRNVPATPYIAIHLADKWLEGSWQAADVIHFLRAVKQATGLALVATAGPVDQTVRKAVEQAMGADCPLLTQLSFGQWAAVFAGASLVITPDCGALHIACAVQKPLLALYPPARMAGAVAEFGPRGTACRTHPLDNPTAMLPILLADVQALLAGRA